MIKVCHMTSAHGEEDVRIFHKECVSLAKAGYDTYLVERGESREKNGVHIIGVGEIPASRRKRMTEGAKKVYEAARAVDADVYHLHDPELLPYGLKLKKAGKKVIFDSHEHTAEAILEKTWITPLIRMPVYWAYSAYQSSVCHRLDAVVTVTPHMVDYFKKRNSRTAFVSNYPLLEEMPAESSSVEKVKAIGFAGGVSELWNHEKIITALERIPDCRYCLCGNGEERYLDLLKALPGWGQVDFFGRIPHREVVQKLAQCTAGMAIATPGRNSGFLLGTMGNTKIFEEMMAGLPIICTNFVLWKEFVERYHCGICVDSANVDEIADSIRYLLDHPDEARQMGENGRRAVKEEFNWGVEEKKLLALYEDVLK